MKKYFLILSILMLRTCFQIPAHAQQYLEKQDTNTVNLLKNPGFESGLGQWTYTSGTVSIVSDTAAIQGEASIVFQPTGVSQTVSSKLYSTKGLNGNKCQADITYQTTESTNPYIFRVVDSLSTVLISTSLPSVISATKTSVLFDCTANSIQTQLVAATSSPASIKADGEYLGTRKNLTAQDVNTALGYIPANQTDLNTVSSTVNALNAASSTYLVKSANLSDLVSATVARNNLGLGSVAVENIVPSSKGGTGQSTYNTGDILYASGSTLVKLPIGTTGQSLQVSSTSVPYWTTVSAGTSTNTLQSVVSTTTLTGSSNYVFIDASGGPYTVTLPSASTTGVLLTLQKIDIVSHIVTLSTQFGQTIEASSTSRLNTVNETLNLISSGTTWAVLSRDTRATHIGSGTIVIGATVTPPTKGAGDYDNVYAERLSGTVASVKYKFRQGVAGASGSGDYLFTLPAGLRFDPSKVFFSTTANVFDSILQGSYVGTGTIANNTNAGYCTAMAYDATRFRMACTVNFANHGWFGSGLYGLGGGTVGFSMTLHNVDIEQWLP